MHISQNVTPLLLANIWYDLHFGNALSLVSSHVTSVTSELCLLAKNMQN